MKRRPVRIAAGFVALALLALGGTALAGDRASKKPTRLAAATMIVEVDATAGDAGVQFFLDGEPWDSMTISGPGRNGRTLLEIDAKGRLKGWGLTELFAESNEPAFDVVPLEVFKKRFPEGRYTFVGKTIEGERIVGKARLSHDIPDGPEITAPADGAEVGRTSVVARWVGPPEPPGIDIVGYRVIVTRDDPLRVYSVDLVASANRVPIPAEFLEPGTEYELEIQAIEDSGNQTFSTTAFTVR